MFRNVCVLALVVLCGQAASAFSANMVMGMASKVANEMMAMGMTCLKENKADGVMVDPSAEKIVHGGGCIVGCLMKTVGMLKDGKINAGFITSNIPKNMPMADKVHEIMKHCSDKAGDTCSTPFTFGKCICSEGPLKEIIEAIKAFCTSMIMEVVKASM